ncbi:MAG: sugar phosphate isomerase/epimerase, partial [Clostridia bacterium]|nr:sugar phosphate isomerase/epimerase [Clostridia bacterium]
LKTQIDTCWVKYSGLDPAEYVRKYTGRAPIVHLKDYVGTKGEAQPYALIKEDGSDDGANSTKATFEFRPVGHGCQDVASILKAGLEAGAEIFIVEQDQWYDRHPLEAAKMSIDAINSFNIL